MRNQKSANALPIFTQKNVQTHLVIQWKPVLYYHMLVIYDVQRTTKIDGMGPFTPPPPLGSSEDSITYVDMLQNYTVLFHCSLQDNQIPDTFLFCFWFLIHTLRSRYSRQPRDPKLEKLKSIIISEKYTIAEHE